MFKKLFAEIVLVGGFVVGVGEALSTTLPAGTLRTVIQVALPIVIAVLARFRAQPFPNPVP
jgi:hypothetical protein